MGKYYKVLLLSLLVFIIHSCSQGSMTIYNSANSDASINNNSIVDNTDSTDSNDGTEENTTDSLEEVVLIATKSIYGTGNLRIQDPGPAQMVSDGNGGYIIQDPEPIIVALERLYKFYSNGEIVLDVTYFNYPNRENTFLVASEKVSTFDLNDYSLVVDKLLDDDFYDEQLIQDSDAPVICDGPTITIKFITPSVTSVVNKQLSCQPELFRENIESDEQAFLNMIKNTYF